MTTILKHCTVPWAVLPTDSVVTLVHTETMEGPECSVVLGGGRLRDDDKIDSRRIEIAFSNGWYARAGQHHDSAGVEKLGYRLLDAMDVVRSEETIWDCLVRRAAQWRATGIAPYSGFYVAIESDWLRGIVTPYGQTLKHYVIFGRDGHVEVLAAGYTWREWLWTDEHFQSLTDPAKVAASGTGLD